ncbi:protein phosphatase 2C domain-containing protein [Microlunatus sp. Y2014]|uniref:protein phosphatase 2C domain-containing protein n=1 Tax=Microlunatus sp. Y2014 TaxID=3418488 RepID=UPI003DA6F2E7
MSTPPNAADDTNVDAAPDAEVDHATDTEVDHAEMPDLDQAEDTEVSPAPDTEVDPPGADQDPSTSSGDVGPDSGGEDEQDFPSYPSFASYPGAPQAAPALPTAVVTSDGSRACPNCAEPLEAWAGFCENCGQSLTPSAPMPKGPVRSGSQRTRRTGLPGVDDKPRHPCAECGGQVGADNYCEQCGAKAPNARDHFREAPANWVAGVCDRGIRHSRNEDALALSADTEPGSRAVLIVCDGVSNADDSHIASLAAARTARGVLTVNRPNGVGVEASRVAAISQAITDAAAQANQAVIDKSDTESANPPSCTFAVAVLDGDTLVYGNLGDSRVYWIDDEPGASRQLTTDDSIAQTRITMGVEREIAENGPQAHAITKWLGRDAPDLTPNVGSTELTGSGWVLVCSDGLWNYASDADGIAGLVHEAIERNPGNRRVRSLAVSLVRWARQQGGKDNITVALARIGEFDADHGATELLDRSEVLAQEGTAT